MSGLQIPPSIRKAPDLVTPDLGRWPRIRLSVSSNPPMIAAELRRQADTFMDLLELKDKVERDSSERPLQRNPK
jgi:hypothetical protein